MRAGVRARSGCVAPLEGVGSGSFSGRGSPRQIAVACDASRAAFNLVDSAISSSTLGLIRVGSARGGTGKGECANIGALSF